MSPYDANSLLVVITVIIGVAGLSFCTMKIVTDKKEDRRVRLIREKYEKLRK